MIDVITVISDHVVAGLEEAGYPPLAKLLNGRDGKILIGRRHDFDQYTPPRIIFFPTKTTFSGRRNTLGTVRVADNTNGRSAEARAAMAQRALYTKSITFEVSCFGIASADVFEEDGAAADFAYTNALVDQVIASLQYKIPGDFKVEGGIWRDAPHLKRVGREFIFGVTIHVPVLDELTTIVDGVVPGLPFAPSNVGAEYTDSMVAADGTTEGGSCSDD